MPKNTLFYPTDHCGWICVKDSAPINVKYLRYVLELAGKREGFSRTKRPTYDRIKALDIRLPELDVQNQVIKEIEPLETEIEKYTKQINDLPKNQMTIVEKYIK